MSLLLGFKGAEEQIFPIILRMLDAAYTRHQRLCAANHNLKEIGDKIIPYERNSELLGAPERPLEDVFKCARFRVEIDSAITVIPSGSSGTFNYHYLSTIDVRLDLNSQNWHGSGAGSFSDASGTVTTTTSCGSPSDTRTTTTNVTGSHGNTTTISDFLFAVKSDDPDQSFKLRMSSDASEDYHSDSSGCGLPSDSGDSTDQGWFNSLTADHSSMGEGSD